MLRTCAYVLRAEEFDTLAYDGETGLNMAYKKPHNLIILDLMLPKLDGWEICRRLRQNQATRSSIMLTAKSEEEDKILDLKWEQTII